MSLKKEANHDYSEHNLVSVASMKTFEGEMLTTIEMLGLPHKQEEAIKSEFRKKFWTNLQTVQTYISPPMMEHVWKTIDENRALV